MHVKAGLYLAAGLISSAQDDNLAHSNIQMPNNNKKAKARVKGCVIFLANIAILCLVHMPLNFAWRGTLNVGILQKI